jgi:hypothetical protein
VLPYGIFMTLKDLLALEGIDPTQVIALRHTLQLPLNTQLLGRIADADRAAFNLYQRIQRGQTAMAIGALAGQGYIASFIGQCAAQATFVGLYKVGGFANVEQQDLAEFTDWQILADLGFTPQTMFGAGPEASIIFELQETPTFQNWSGKLIIDWPAPDISWRRRVHDNIMPIRAITEETRFAPPMPPWRDLLVKWQEISTLPPSWRVALSHWRGVYFIHDSSDGKGYVGSAYGDNNIIGRWDEYAQTGHGGAVGLYGRDPNNFTFSILERVAPEADIAEVVAIENSWKKRLHTYIPDGINHN